METITTQSTTASAIECPTIESQPEHQWLQQLVGEWRYETEAVNTDGSCEQATGVESVRSLGDFWIIAKGEGTGYVRFVEA